MGKDRPPGRVVYSLLQACFLVFLADLSRLRGAAERRCRLAFRPGTRANRSTIVLLYIAFTLHFQLRDFPATQNNLLLFGEFLVRGYRAPKSVTNALSALKTFHAIHGWDTSGFLAPRLGFFKRALPLTLRSVPNRAPPFPFALLERLCTFLREGGNRELVFAALLSCTFFAMTRLSSMAPPDRQRFDTSRYPTLDDVSVSGREVFLQIKWAKAHQEAGEAFWVPLLRVGGSPACPVDLLERARRALPGRLGGAPLFGVGDESHFFFTVQRAREWLRWSLMAVGRGGSGYTFHSLRRGACSLAFENGADIADIQNLGGWRSNAVQCYLPVMASRNRAAAALLP